MYSSTHSLTSALDGGEWLASRLGCLTPRERAPGTHWIGGWMDHRVQNGSDGSRQFWFYLSWGFIPDWRTGLSCNRSRLVRVFDIYVYNFFFFFFFILGLQPRFRTANYAYFSYTAQGYIHSLDSWPIVWLTATNNEPCILSVLSLALASVANIDIFML
jgi:hypothetical protein